MEPIRKTYKIERRDFARFIDNINKDKTFVFKAHNPSDDNVMQDRYTFAKNNLRVSIVYETKAQTLIVTAPDNIMCDLDAILDSKAGKDGNVSKTAPDANNADNGIVGGDNKKSDSQGSGANRVKTGGSRLIENTKSSQSNSSKVRNKSEKPKTKTTTQPSGTQSKTNMTQPTTQPKANTTQPTAQAKTKPAQTQPSSTQPKVNTTKPTAQTNAKSAQTQPNGTQSKVNTTQPTAQAKTKPAQPTTQSTARGQKKTDKSGASGQTKNGSGAVASKRTRKVTTAEKSATDGQTKGRKDEKADKSSNFIITKVAPERENELVKKLKANKNMRYKLTTADDGTKVYSISSQKERAIIRYSGGNLQLNGTRGDLFSELQLIMSQISDYKTAIKSHIRSTGEEKRAGEVGRQLKKKLPNAIEFLSEQAKIDLAIGIIDINNSAVVLSDYSTLLIPCFRGLERLIFDLQHAQGIVVKMIGQAYEKVDGNYVLKYGYRRRIPSVIYAEVMAALYTEYYMHRNFYAHSDGGYDNISRVITDKQQIMTIFNHILEVINYNGKNLKEIGFSIK